ncbi:MAG: ATP-binding protein [Fibromonadaceae bacterium]|nr:ATP-binding protein [Fibromonadaceae bacterium]
MPQKYFNIAGPCHSSEHYMLNPLRNIGKELISLIERKGYFVIHAARQSGKTTLLWELVDKINAEGKYYALYCSLEKIQGIVEAKEAMPEIIDVLKIAFYNSSIPKGELFAKGPSDIGFASLLQFELSKISKALDKPLIIFFDEADCLSNGTLISFLRQLRDGFVSRARVPFVHSIALVGMRNIRDYKAHIRDDSVTLGSASPFNIVTEVMTLKNFTKDEVAELYNQHTVKKSQIFDPVAVDYIFEQTQGQP